MIQHRALTAGLLTGVSLFALATTASAQTAPSGEVEQVIVTGSRVIQNGNNMPTPVTVVTAEALQTTTPTTIADGLQALPVFAGGRSTTTNPGNSSQNNAARTLNLRSLGANRTLVLFDGRRVPPTSPLGEVNADFVPSLLLQRVDVVTGGASAVYGSDAISGVVNFITDRNFNGIKLNASVGRSERGDGDEQRIGIAGGMELFGGRGHIEGSYEYYNSPGILSKQSREWGQQVWTVQGSGTTAVPYRLVRNTRLTRSSFFGVINAQTATVNAGNPLRDMVFRQNGVLSPFQHGTAVVSGVESGGDGAFFYNSSLASLYQSDLGFARFDYDLTDTVHFYAAATGMLSRNMNNHETNEFNQVTISATNAFLSPQYQTAMTAAGRTTFLLSKMLTQINAKQPESYTRGYMANFGLEGSLGEWKWDISWVNSKNQQRTRNNYNPRNDRASAALDAVFNPANGQVVCNVTLTNPGLYPGCVPLNLFGPTSESKAALDYVFQVSRYKTNTAMNNVGGTIAGPIFELPAGQVQAAVSGEWRKLTYELTSNSNTLPISCVGLRFNCGPTTTQFQSNVLNPRTKVSQSVSEISGELDVPLLKDLALVDSLNINAAGRYTDYDTSGTVSTWKLGIDWKITSDLTFRGTRSRDIRAPNLNDLFAPRLVNPAGVTDNHTAIVGQAPFITDPNPDLAPEVAKTWTAGVVYRPSFIPRFSLAADWYQIKIANAITVIQGQNAVIQNICIASNGTSEFCKLIERPLPFSNRTPANFVTAFYSKPQNAQVVDTHGVDIEANYNFELLGGTVNTRGLVSWQPILNTIQFPGAPVSNGAGIAGLAEWRSTVFLKYTKGPWQFDTQTRWHNKTDWNADRSFIYAEKKLPAVFTTNATVSYNWARSQAFLTVTNLFDKQPTPFGGTGGASSVAGLFGGWIQGEDTIGRYYTIGVRLRM